MADDQHPQWLHMGETGQRIRSCRTRAVGRQRSPPTTADSRFPRTSHLASAASCTLDAVRASSVRSGVYPFVTRRHPVTAQPAEWARSLRPPGWIAAGRESHCDSDHWTVNGFSGCADLGGSAPAAGRAGRAGCRGEAASWSREYGWLRQSHGKQCRGCVSHRLLIRIHGRHAEHQEPTAISSRISVHQE
jgi:hypothetical protein